MSELTKESKKEKRERKKEKKEKKEKKVKDITTEEAEKVVAEESEQEVPQVQNPEENDSDNDNDNDKKESNELEIDLNAAVPLSKKKQRALKKGKLDLEKIARKNPAPKPLTEEGDENSGKKSRFAVWIGNLAFDTTKLDLVNFILEETKANEGEHIAVKNEEITRVNIPKKNDKIKGFAYVDFTSPEHVKAVVALSERRLHNRNLLIKDSTSYAGRPEEHTTKAKALSKNPPSRILFVGNLPFDTTDELLQEHFSVFGKITRVRMATFQDTGKCKGFAFLDFVDEEGPTAALKSKQAKTFINRPLRLEFGEDRSKRNPKRMETEGENVSGRREHNSEGTEHNFERTGSHEQDFVARDSVEDRPRKTFKRPAERHNDSNKRMKSSIALATAQRQSMAIVPSQGKKMKFD